MPDVYTVNKEARNRAAIVEALNKSIAIFSAHEEKTFDQVITNGIRPIAEAVGLDRVVVYAIVDREGEKRFGQIYRWDKSEGGLMSLAEELRVLPNIPVIKQWIAAASKGESVIRMRESHYNEAEAAFLRKYGIKSLLLKPIFTHGELWGAVAFQDHTNDRYFDEGCADLLHSAALMCANTVIRADMEREIENSNVFIRAILNASPLGFTIFDENVRVIDCNDITLKEFGTTKKYYIEHFLEFSPEFQSDGTKSADKAVDAVKRALNGENLMFEWIHRTSKGELIPYEITLTHTKYNGKYVALGYQYDLRNTKKMLESIREQGEQLKIRLEQQMLISEISRGFISSGDSQMLVKEAIAKLGHYHKVSLVFIFAMDYQRKDTYLAYHWCADAVSPRGSVSNLFNYIKSIFPENLPDCSTMPIIACEDTSTNQGELYKALASINVRAIIGAPLYVEGRLWGIMCVEQNSTPRKWTENEKGFAAMIASTIAGVIMRDIYTTKLKEALHNATEASKAKSEFLSNMSHEMRTPLNAITGMTAIGRNAKDIERKDYALGKIQDASTHLLGVINDVLDMSKIEANMLELSPVEFNFEKMLQNTAAVVNFRVEEKRQKLTVHIDRKIPQTLIADDQRLAQVVTNLLSNAVKFTPEEGDITLNANFLGEENGVCTIQVDVSDTGIGISGEQQKRLFSSFQQAESGITRKYGGTGLGLAISKKIVEMMDGRIWVLSEPEKGSTFSFIIKARRGEEDWQKSLPDANLSNIHILGIDKRQAETTPPADITGIFTGRRILLVEDIEINREIVQALLEPTRLEIDCAENGVQAVRMFSEAPQKYDMIFMDVQMPEMDGYEATRRIRALDNPKAKNIPIIAMTANVFREDIEKCLEAGMSSHIGKPLNFDTVLEKLRAYLPVS